MSFKGTKGEWEVIEHNWSDTSIVVNGKTICKFELDDIDEEDLSEEENEYNISLISKAPDMLDFINRISGEMLRNDFVLDEKWYEQAKQLIKEATELQK